MNRIVVKKAEDCPFSIYYDTMWCTAPRIEEFDDDPNCILWSKLAPPCPLVGGLRVELENDEMVNWKPREGGG